MIKEYKVLLSEIGNTLKRYEFGKKGDDFLLAKDENWGLIGFQKSRNSTSENIVFTINVGVCSGALRRFAGEILSVKPKTENCHWKKRIGALMGSNTDFWFQLNKETNMSALVNEITEILVNKALPELQRHLTDNDLKEAWMQGCDGLTELQRYIYLTTLMKLSGDQRLNTVVEELKNFAKGKSFAYTAQVHLQELGLQVG